MRSCLRKVPSSGNEFGDSVMKLRFIILPIFVSSPRCNPLAVREGAVVARCCRSFCQSRKRKPSTTRPDLQPSCSGNHALQLCVRSVRVVPIGIAAVEAGIDQEDNSPPEWKQGAAGYGRRSAFDLRWDKVSSVLRAISQARVILGDSERQVAEKFVEAARTYANDPYRLPFARHEHAVRGVEAKLHNRHLKRLHSGSKHRGAPSATRRTATLRQASG